MVLYWIIENGQQAGPFSKEELRSRGITGFTQVWTSGMQYWANANTVPDLADIVANTGTTPPPFYPPRQNAFENPEQHKDKTLTGIFAILLGWLGVHYFYVGKVLPGVICIIATILSCGIWQIITLIQGILILTMNDNEFYQKYEDPNISFPLF